MKKLVFPWTLLLAVSLATVQPASAQGGVIDWIHRLSGPSMLGPALSYQKELIEDGLRFRLTAAYRVPVGAYDKIEFNHSLNMVSLQPAIEIPIREPFEINAGLAFHRFGGSGHDPVFHWSIPVYGQLRVATEDLMFRFGLGGHYFPTFSEEDFRGEGETTPGVHVNSDGGEFSLALYLGVDWSWR